LRPSFYLHLNTLSLSAVLYEHRGHSPGGSIQPCHRSPEGQPSIMAEPQDFCHHCLPKRQDRRPAQHKLYLNDIPPYGPVCSARFLGLYQRTMYFRLPSHLPPATSAHCRTRVVCLQPTNHMSCTASYPAPWRSGSP
jgi:hypothetical protein